jgi:hypothetical protein
VRAGDDSLHRRWLAGEQSPTFDLAVSYYGDGPSAFSDAAILHAAKGGKWDGLFAFFVANPGVLERYDWIWFPDDDLDTNADSINRLFDIVERYGLDVAQPSLSWDSYYSHFATLQNRACRLRFTNFVEVMAPVLSAALLRRILPAFAKNRFGWGMELLWPRWMPEPRFKTAIVDEVAVRHTRPTGQGTLSKGSRQAATEENEAFRSLYLPFPPPIVNYAAITPDGLTVTSRLRLFFVLHRGWKQLLQFELAQKDYIWPGVPITPRRLRRAVTRSCFRRVDLAPIAFHPEYHQDM